MFNTTLFLILVLTSFFETYKIVNIANSSKYQQLSVLNKQNNLFLLQLLFVWVFLYKNMYINNVSFNFFFFSILSTILIYYLFSTFFINDNSSIVILCLVTLVMYVEWSFITFVLISELLTLVSFFFLFFFNKNMVDKHFSKILYFFLSNILILFFGILSILLILKNYGTANINTLLMVINNNPDFLFKVTFSLYLIFKLSQGPIVFAKFKFYKVLNIKNLLIYLFIYVILIWPFLLNFFSNLNMLVDSNILIVIFFLSTLLFLKSTNMPTSLINFLVFSTWAYSWFLLLYLVNWCLILRLINTQIIL